MTARLRWILLSVLLLGVTPHARQVIIRVPPPAATVTIQLPSVSSTYDAGVASSIPVSGIATTLTSVTGCTWTNSLGGSGAATGVPNYTWSIASVPLAFGSNVVTIFCADVYLQTGTAVITITRTIPPIPTVTITAPTASPTYDAGTTSTITVSGTASTAATITGCTWVNSLGGSGAASGTTSWSVANLPLTIGTNTVTVTCLDQFSQAGNDVIAITRSASGPTTNPIDVVRMPSTSATLPDGTFAGAGVLGGIPTSLPNCDNSACTALAPGGAGTVSTATVDAATAGAQVGGVACSTSLATACVVRLRAGSFTLSGGIHLGTSFVILRGAGPSQTLLTTGFSSTGCGYSYISVVVICAGGGYSTTDTTWTAGYAKGDTSITIGNRTGLVAGRSMVHLAQLNDDGYPTANGIYMTDSGPPISGTSGDCGSPASTGISGSCVAQDSLVTACAGSCSGAGTITIDPPLSGTSMRSGRTNSARFGGSPLQWAGLENLSFDFSAVAAHQTYGIQINNATNVWVKNVRQVNTGASSYGLQMIRSARISLVDNYIVHTNNHVSGQEDYGMVIQGAGSVLIQNNIIIGHGSGIITDNSFNNAVIAYNFWAGTGGVSYGKHLGGENMILLEGNIGRTLWADNIDAVACCHIAFRNALLGNRYDHDTVGNVDSAIAIAAKNHMWSVVGNVISNAAFYGSNYTCTDSTCVYDLGGDIGQAGAPFDAAVGSTMFRWFNWDHVTSTADNTNNDQTGTRCVAGEVPTGLAFMPNALPASCAAPNSLYLSAKPAWWPASLPWPGIGPDISGGTITNTGGHVYLNPAANCYLVTMGMATDGTGTPGVFTCW